MEIYNDRLCLTGEEVWAVLGSNFNTLLSRGRVRNLLGRACYNRSALYDVDDFPNNKKNRYRDELYSAYPELTDWKAIREAREFRGVLIENIVPDPKAKTFFEEHTKPNGETLKPEEIRRYVNSAMLLNAIRRTWETMYSHHARAQKVSKIRKGDFFINMSKAMLQVREYFSTRGGLSFKRFNSRRLQELYEAYGDNNYASLLSGKTGNRNGIKVTAKIENIILSIYASKDKPFVTEVLAVYNEFLLGMVDVVDRKTGEIYDRNDFYKNGEPVIISEGTVWKIINSPKNRRLVDAIRNDSLYNRKTHEPHTQRKSPQFSFSKITMDDRDLTRKTTSKETVSAYYAYDVASGCVIGASYSKDKNMGLVVDCFRDMFRFIGKHNFNMPGEVEVEHHLMNKLTDELNAIFSIVTFCAAGNSQQKRAENFNWQKKYGAEKKLKQTTGRWWAKHEAYLQRSERVGAEYKEKLLPYNRLKAEDLEAIEKYNNEKHPNQKLYPGMSRLDVLISRQNPKLPKMNKPVCYRYFGHAQKTSLKRSKSVTVQYKEWWLPTPELIDRFKPNNYECTAYYLPDAGGNIESVYLYQGDRFIAECKDIGVFNESKFEQTDEDLEIMTNQLKYISKYRKMVKDGKEEKLSRLKIIPVAQTENAIIQANITEAIGTSPPVGEEPEPELAGGYAGYELEDYAAMAIRDF